MAHGTLSVVLVVGIGIAGIGLRSVLGPAAAAPGAATTGPARAERAAIHGPRVAVGNGADPARRVLAVLDHPASGEKTSGHGVGGLEIRWLSTGERLRFHVPAGASIQDARFTRDGRQLALDVNGPDDLHLWLVDPETAANPLVVPTPLSEGWGSPCDWDEDGAEVLCRVALERGQVEGGFNSPAGVQLAFVNRTTGQVRRVGPAGEYETADLAPGGRFILVGRVGRAAGPSGSGSSGPGRVSEIWNRSGDARRRFLGRERQGGGLLPPPTWDPSSPARLVWVENNASGGDRVCSLEAPFTSDPILVFEATGRVDRLSWAGNGMLFAREAIDRRLVTWAIAAGGGGEPKKVWEK